jgi:Arc/MetJ-type ribon-helix-helix transcriptional regulator
MRRSKEEKKPRGPRSSFQLPPEVVKELRERAKVETRGNVSELIRQRLASATAVRSEVEVQDFWPLIALISAMLDEMRLGRTFSDEHMSSARALFGLILERCFRIDGVAP